MPSDQLRTLFLDLNSYFASVEQQCRPELRGKPVGVVPVEAETTCCIAVSREAKRYGVSTGIGVREARQLCPDITFVTARPAEYVRFHNKICKAVESCIPIESVLSIDEMSCRLNANESEKEKATVIAHRVKQAIHEQVGETLTCSIGLAPNRFLAKVATDMKKPDGLVVIAKQDLPYKLHGLQLRDLPGIGENMEVRLNRNGVYTIPELYERSERELEKIWCGVVGKRFWRWLRGEETESKPTHKQSVGHQHVLPGALRTDEKARAVAVKLLHKAAARMRYLGYFSRGLSLSIGLEGLQTWRAQIRLTPTQDTLELLVFLSQMWSHRPEGTPSFLDVTLFDLQHTGEVTQPLFEQEQNGLRLSRAMDRINQKFGRNTICCASMKGAEDAAPGGISFASVPDLRLADTVPESRDPLYDVRISSPRGGLR